MARCLVKGSSESKATVNMLTQNTSAQGQKRRFERQPTTSGLPLTPDILSARRHVSKVAISDITRLPDPPAIVTPTGHERPEILDRGSRGWNRRETFALVCAASRMEWLQARPRV